MRKEIMKSQAETTRKRKGKKMGYKDKGRQIIFRDIEHRDFFLQYLGEYGSTDTRRLALFYCLGISPELREQAESVYDFDTDEIQTGSLLSGRFSGSSEKALRLAVSLYMDALPGMDGKMGMEEKLEESSRYAVHNLFDCEYAGYFWQALQLRYPEYC